jgi:hypothetical protein
MKPIILHIILLFGILKLNAGTIQAVQNNSDWSTSTTWDLGRIPTNGDIIIIPAGITVTITPNINTPGNSLTIYIYGTLNFVGGGAKLTINSSSNIVVYAGGMITSTGSPSQTLSIGSNTVYQGNQAPIVGAQYANNTTGSGFMPFIPLPVKFISFSLAYKSNCVLIQWSTSEEINSYNYTIERSINGTNWFSIAEIASSGNSNSVKNYSYTDDYVIQGKVYYRIKQTDISGYYTYTPIKALTSGSLKMTDIKIYSTGQSSIILQFPQLINDYIQVRIFSVNGQLISVTQLNKPFGQMIINTNKKGNYIISVSDNKNINVASQVIL